jgi:hypothetical protein
MNKAPVRHTGNQSHGCNRGLGKHLGGQPHYVTVEYSRAPIRRALLLLLLREGLLFRWRRKNMLHVAVPPALSGRSTEV